MDERTFDQQDSEEVRDTNWCGKRIIWVDETKETNESANQVVSEGKCAKKPYVRKECRKKGCNSLGPLVWMGFCGECDEANRRRKEQDAQKKADREAKASMRGDVVNNGEIVRGEWICTTPACTNERFPRSKERLCRECMNA